MKNGDFEQGANGWQGAGGSESVARGVRGKALRVTGPLTQAFDAKPNTTYVVSLYQRRAAASEGKPADTLLFSVKTRQGGEVCTAPLPLSDAWEERTVSFRTGAESGELLLGLSPLAGKDAALAAVDAIECCAVRYRTSNHLLQETPGVAPVGGLGGDDADGGGLLGDGDGLVTKREPPEVEQFIPWVDHIGVAIGAAKPKVSIPWLLMFDGRLAGHESSWTGRPLPMQLAKHASLTMRFKESRRIGVVAVYEDMASASRYADSFAVFLKTEDGWRLGGYRAGNRSPFNLITFEPREVAELQYFWTGSADGHVRAMEIEAYGTEEDIMEEL